jgi:site-specific DNA-methyltransferase (adenine-specific)
MMLEAATLIHGDCRLMLPHLPPVDVVLTDPPYMTWETVAQEYAAHPLWSVTAMMQQWYPLVLQRTRVGLWMTTDRRYLPYYALPEVTGRVWPLMPTPVREPMLCYVGRPLRQEPSPALLGQFRYGQDSPVAWWAGLLALCPCERGVVLDPFCGTGSSLVAGLEAGYRVIGLERDEATYDRCRTRVRTCLNTLSGVYSGPSGPGQET